MKQNQMNDASYSTSDIYFAAFLIATGYSQLKGIEDGERRRRIFIFEPKPSQEIILKFYSGEEKVSALRLLESLQSLKSATYLSRGSSR